MRIRKCILFLASNIFPLALILFLSSCSHHHRTSYNSEDNFISPAAAYGLTPEQITALYMMKLKMGYPNTNIQTPQQPYSQQNSNQNNVKEPPRIHRDGSIFQNNRYIGRLHQDGSLYNAEGQRVGTIGRDGTIYDINGNHMGNLY